MAENYAAREDGSFRVISSLPDVNITPVGSAKVPIPYAITATLGKANNASNNVFIERHAAFIASSDTISTTGGAPGTDKGIKSGTVNDKAEPKDKSSSFFINKQQVIRVFDTFYMNSKNTLGTLVQSIPVPKDRITDDGALPPPPESEQGFFESAWEWLEDAGNQALTAAVELDDKFKVMNRVEGVGMFALGLGEMVTGAALIIVPEPTMATKVAGLGTFGLGLDTGSSGLDQVWTGERASTTLDKTVEDGAQMVGLSPEMAASAATVFAGVTKPTKIAGDLAHQGMDALKSEVKAQAAEQLGLDAPEGVGGKGKGKGKKQPPPKKTEKSGTDGAESKGAGKCPSKEETKRKGDCAESLINEKLKKEGFEPFDTSKLTNNQGNGFDNVGTSQGGDVRMVVIETKANQSKLNKKQKLGGESRTEDLIKEMEKATRLDGHGRYKHMMEYADKKGLIPKSKYSSPDEFKAKLKELMKELEKAKGSTFYCLCRVILKKDETGCYGEIDKKTKKKNKKSFCEATSIMCTPWFDKDTPSTDKKDEAICKRFAQK